MSEVHTLVQGRLEPVTPSRREAIVRRVHPFAAAGNASTLCVRQQMLPGFVMRGCVTRQHAARTRRAVELGQTLLLDRVDRLARQFEHDGTARLITQKQAEEQVSQLPG